jgi:hypothetical protein
VVARRLNLREARKISIHRSGVPVRYHAVMRIDNIGGTVLADFHLRHQVLHEF